ncbi:hypothetical protein [Actinoallomurus iriomotensis]|nr:hypothetical protein [Actinoallomurus iriomotensis]
MTTMPETTALPEETGPDVINVSLRECRLVGYRVLWHHGAPAGAIPAIVDAIVAAEAAGLEGLRALHADGAAIGATAARPVTYTRAGDELVIDAAGKHALAAVPDIVDLAAALGDAAVLVTGAERDELLAVLPHVAPDHGLALAPDGPGRFRCRPATPSYEGSGPPSAAGILHDGTDVPAHLWWALFHLGNLALTPDSVVSRRHTGRSVFDAQGRIVGELGEDAQEPDAATPAIR